MTQGTFPAKSIGGVILAYYIQPFVTGQETMMV